MTVPVTVMVNGKPQTQMRQERRTRWSPAAGTVRNVFDADPPFYDAITGIGFDAGQADPLGRTFALQLTKRW